MRPEPTNVADTGKFPGAELKSLEKAIRRIVRASDLQSRAHYKAVGLTTPQLVVLKGVAALGEVTTTALSAYADLSAATVVTILDNLEERRLIERYRSLTDRRIVHTRLTSTGKSLVATAPEPLGAAFAERLAALPAARRARIVASVVELADLIGGPPGDSGRGSAQ